MEADPKLPAISSLKAHRRRQSPASQNEILHEIARVRSDIVDAGLEPRKVVQVVLDSACALTHSAGAVIEMSEGARLVCWATSGSLEPLHGVRFSVVHTLSGTCLERNEVLICDDSETDVRVDRDACRRAGVRSMVVTPLRHADSTVGVLKVVSPWVKAYGWDDVRFLALLKEFIDASIARSAEHADALARANASGAQSPSDRGAALERIAGVIREGSFELAFQPVVDMIRNGVVGYEALSRFSGRPSRPPDAWFDEAARVGFGEELELAVVERALSAMPSVPVGAYLAINISPATAQRPELLKLCAAHDTSRIVLELTEHATVTDYATLVDAAERLKRIGLRLAIDDAGAGFASLQHILHLQPALIKLDRSLVKDIDRKPGHQRMLSALLMFAAGTQAELVAEGIETAEERAVLLDLGIRWGQGYLLGQPAPLPS